MDSGVDNLARGDVNPAEQSESSIQRESKSLIQNLSALLVYSVLSICIFGPLTGQAAAMRGAAVETGGIA